MDVLKYMVIIKGEFKTKEIKFCDIDKDKSRYIVTYNNGRTYTYSKQNVVILDKPRILDPQKYIIETHTGKRLFRIKCIYEFNYQEKKYWHVLFDDFDRDYETSELIIKNNVLDKTSSKNVFEYLKEISELSELKNDENRIILKGYFDKIDFIPNSSVLSLFLDNTKKPNYQKDSNIIFPFGCNNSQYEAVLNALENQVSIIQGPPGTGKTQTILNIIANLIIRGKTVLVVSNNNSATSNILEKLSKSEYGLDFMVAPLGCAENKRNFIEKQNGEYPSFLSYNKDEKDISTINEISNLGKELINIYKIQEKLAKMKEKKYKIELEERYFLEFVKNTFGNFWSFNLRKNLSPNKILKLWIELQNKCISSKRISMFFKLKLAILYGIFDFNVYKREISEIITAIQREYYQRLKKEIDRELVSLSKELNKYTNIDEKKLIKWSLAYLRSIISKKYDYKKERVKFGVEDLFRKPKEVVEEYPIVLSSTFSAYTSINVRDMEFDYVIMDEASQVDLATGALALAGAKNAVIVGDLKQLPNVVTLEKKKRADFIRKKYNICDAYDYANKSFLQSIIEVISDAPSILLKEHYRCNPRIIGFCNQKFYNNELVIMSKDDNNDKTLTLVRTVEGNHERDNYSQRQIDTIKREILPTLNLQHEEIGIIAPYNHQVSELKKQTQGIEIATVHKFQGREKDIIILSTVDDVIKEFTDDPYLLNVAVSRAKKRLIVVVSGNKQKNNGNIIDLISYIQYNNGVIIDSQVYSVFDFLYSQYKDERMKYLKTRKKISQYDSENLMYAMLQDILKKHSEYSIICFQPLYMVIRDLNKLSKEERKYVLNPSTHLDFTIFNKISKQPVLAIEVDGYGYHKEGTKQFERDKLKERILEVCGIQLVRIKTNGSGEEKIIREALGLC